MLHVVVELVSFEISVTISESTKINLFFPHSDKFYHVFILAMSLGQGKKITG